MATYSFTFKNILVNIDTEVPTVDGTVCTVSYIAPRHTNVLTVDEMGDFSRKKGQSQIIVDRYQQLFDNGEPVNKRVPLPPLTFTNKQKNKMGVGQYTAFNTLATGSTSMGIIADLAIINTHLESEEIINVFKEPIPCFNPYNPITPWGFIEPIEVDFDVVHETTLGLNNGKIIVEIVRPETGNFEVKITRKSDNVVIQDWNINLAIENLQAGEYCIEVRNTSKGSVANIKIATINPGV